MNAQIKLAIRALRKQIQEIAFDANQYDAGLSVSPYAKLCSIKRKRLVAAIEWLEINSLPGDPAPVEKEIRL